MTSERFYVGDGVYVEPHFSCGLELTTSDGETDTNTIILEPEILLSLLMYIDREYVGVSIVPQTDLTPEGNQCPE